MADHSTIPPRYRKYWRLYLWSPIHLLLLPLFIFTIAFTLSEYLVLLGVLWLLQFIAGLIILRNHLRELDNSVESERAECPFCAYRLEDEGATSCPECGAPVSRRDALLIDRRYWRLSTQHRRMMPEAWRSLTGPPFRVFTVPQGKWYLIFLGAMVAPGIITRLHLNAGDLFTPSFFVMLIVKLLLFLVITHAIDSAGELAARKSVAKKAMKNNLALNPEAARPEGMKTVMAISTGDIPETLPDLEETWLELGPLPWHIVDFNDETRTTRSVLPS